MKEANNLFESLFNESDAIVCATSGGIDSMTLLKLLIDYRKEKNIKIICAHINHNLREESYEEYEFVKNYAKENDVIFEGTIFEKKIDGNFESISRKKRYEYFDNIVKKYNAKYLLTAHHGDDLIETILMRIVRGSTLEGYKGFSVITDRTNYKIIRPLVFYSKQEIIDYAKKNNIEYREDKTNFDEKYTRNRYRKNILPLLKKENNNVHLKFLKFSTELKEQYEFIKKYIIDVYSRVYINQKLNIINLKEEDNFVQRKVILMVLNDVYKDNIVNIIDKHVDNIISIINSNKPNLSIDLPMNISAIKSYEYLEFSNGIKQEEYNYEINKEITVIPSGIIKKITETNLTNNYVCHLNSKEINLPIYVRSKKNGDYIEVLGLNGKKKVKDIFINEKIKKDKRTSYPIVVDSNDTVLWIPGIKKSKYDSLKTKNYDIILWYINEEENNE